MPSRRFRIVIGSGDWGSPMADQATFKTLEEAQAAANEYLTREVGGPALRAIIEETTADGATLKHSVD